MNLTIIQNEVRSNALKEIVKQLTTTLNDVKAKKIDYKQANVEIVGCKHIIQSLALDWAYNGHIRSLTTAVENGASKHGTHKRIKT